MKKNFRIKALALLMVLAVLTTSLGFTALAAGSFTDGNEIGAPYAAAVDYIVETKVMTGFEDGSFRPGEGLKREQAAKMIACLLLGSEEAAKLTASSAPFTDVDAGRWSAGYIAYCAKQGIIVGDGTGTFDPAAPLGFLEFAKMLLCAFDIGEPGSYTGAEWYYAVFDAAEDAGLFTGEAGITGAQAAATASITRQQAALLAYNAVRSSKGLSDLSADIEVYGVSLDMFRTNSGSPIGTQRFFRNLDKEISFDLTLRHKALKSAGYVAVELRVSEYDTSKLICSYAFNADVSASSGETKASYTGSLEKLIAYDAGACSDYFSDVNEYKVDVVVNSHILKTFTLTTGYNTLAVDAFAKQIKGGAKFWVSTHINDTVEPENRTYSANFLGTNRTLGAEFNLSYPETALGQLPVTYKWYRDDDPISQKTEMVDFTGTSMTLDASISSGYSSALASGTYICRIYILNNLVAEGECKLTK